MTWIRHCMWMARLAYFQTSKAHRPTIIRSWWRAKGNLLFQCRISSPTGEFNDDGMCSRLAVIRGNQLTYCICRRQTQLCLTTWLSKVGQDLPKSGTSARRIILDGSIPLRNAVLAGINEVNIQTYLMACLHQRNNFPYTAVGKLWLASHTGLLWLKFMRYEFLHPWEDVMVSVGVELYVWIMREEKEI